MAAELEVVGEKQRAEDQAIIKALEKELEEFSGGFPYDRARIIERTQDGFRMGVEGFYRAGLGLILLYHHEGVQAPGQILEQYFPGISRSAAYSYMRFARMASKLPNFKRFCLERGGITKGLTMLETCTTEKIVEFNETGKLYDFTEDQLDNMSHRTMKKAFRAAREHERVAVRKATEGLTEQLATALAENKDLKSQVTAAKTPADAALALVLSAHDKIFDGIRLLGKVREFGATEKDGVGGILTTDKTVREQMVGVCEHAINVLMNLSTDATHAGAVEGADY